MNMIWLPVAVPLVVMAVMLAMDRLQRRVLDDGPRSGCAAAVQPTAADGTP